MYNYLKRRVLAIVAAFMAVFTPVMVQAQTATLESEAVSEIEGLAAKATPILIAALAVVALFILFRVVKKAMRGGA